MPAQPGASNTCSQNRLRRKWDQRFESTSLQRRVCTPVEFKGQLREFRRNGLEHRSLEADMTLPSSSGKSSTSVRQAFQLVPQLLTDQLYQLSAPIRASSGFSSSVKGRWPTGGNCIFV